MRTRCSDDLDAPDAYDTGYAAAVSHRAVLLGYVVLVAACAGARPPPEGVQTLEPDPRPYTATAPATNATPRRTTSSPSPVASTFADPWPDSSMTALARSVTRFTRAAVQGEAWPAELPFPIGRPDGQPRVEIREGALAPPVRVLCFYAEVECSFANAPPPGSGNHNIELALLLCETGIRVVEIDEDPAGPGVTLPPSAAGLATAATDVLAAFALGRGQELLLSDRDRDAVGGEAVFRRAMRDLPRPEQIASLQRLAAQRGPPTGFDLDDMGIIVADANGIVGFQIDLERMAGGFVIDGPPFVSIRRMM